jgi:glycosyltransferase involved in cell wall biosynthesis
MTTPHVRVGILQRVLTDYRVPFFDLLAETFPAGVEIASGEARPEEQIVPGQPEKATHYSLENIHILKGGLYLCQQRGVIEWLEKYDPDVLIVEANPRYLATPQAVRWMHRRKRPVIGWGLGAHQGGGLRSNLRLSFLKEFDALLTYSRKGKADYVSAGLPAETIFVAPNAVVTRPQNDPPMRRSSFNESPAVVLFVGRLQGRKRVDLLVQACAQLDKSIQPRLCVVGDGPERTALESLARQIYPQAEFCGDQRGKTLADLFRQADLFALPGTGGLALQQALSFGLPAIAAEGDGTQADLIRPENGWLVKPGSLESLISALQSALSDPKALAVRGGESFRIVKDEINLENMAAAFETAVAFALERVGK